MSDLESVETLLLRRNFFEKATKIVDILADLREGADKTIFAPPKPEIVIPSIDEITIFVDPATPMEFDKTKDGWELDRPEPVFERGEFILALQEIPEPKWWQFFSNNTLHQAKKLQADLTQRHAEALLRNQDKIPESWWPYFLIFPGTIRRNPDGNRYVPCLTWNGNHWCLHWLSFDGDCGPFERLLRPRKSLYFPS